MAKRKREEDEGAAPTDSVKRRRLQHKLKSSTTKLGHAFKVAKGLERQKLGRRRKNVVAQKDDNNTKRIDAEIEALKTLDTSTIAQQHLYKAISKIKALSKHQDLPEEVKESVKSSSDTAILNVNARLCKSNQVQEALNAALDEIRNAFGLALENVASQKHKSRAKDDAVSANDVRMRKEKGEKKASHLQAGEEARGSSSPESIEDEYASFDHRLAHSSDGDEDAISDVNDIERELAREGGRRKGIESSSQANGYDHGADLSISDAESDRESITPEPEKAPAAKKSSYLPSLTMGGYISGSGSDIEDEVDRPQKKNRRGQRARQQIWEQKFGDSAKHLQKQDRNQGWDPKRGASDGGKGRGRGHQQRGARRSSPDYGLGSRQTKQDNSVPRATQGKDEKKAKHRDDEGRVHPSWEAAKKAKEKKTAPVAFSGKKTTFD